MSESLGKRHEPKKNPCYWFRNTWWDDKRKLFFKIIKNYVLEKENLALIRKNEKKIEKEIHLIALVNSECMSKIYDTTFQAKNIDIRNMDYMIYGVSRNGKIGIGHALPRSSVFEPKQKEMVIKPIALSSYFTYGHTHDTNSTHKPWVVRPLGKLTTKDPKRDGYLKIK